MSSIKNAVIASAGLGSRLGLGLPKSLISFEGKTILSRLIHSIENLIPNIVVVVGYREEVVIELCERYHRNIIIARNPRYSSTNTAESMAIGASLLKGKTLFLDGDLIWRECTVAPFLRAAEANDVLVGVTTAKTDDAVFAECTHADNESLRVLSFSRDKRTPREWANVFVGDSTYLNNCNGFVFENFKKDLPLSAFMIDSAEVDTAEDLDRARRLYTLWSGRQDYASGAD